MAILFKVNSCEVAELSEKAAAKINFSATELLGVVIGILLCLIMAELFVIALARSWRNLIAHQKAISRQPPYLFPF